MLVVRKSLVEKIDKMLNTKVYLYFYNGEEMQKSFNSSLHPRDEHGRFTDKGVMELTEAERQELLDYLEKEEYVEYHGFHIAKEKMEAVRNGNFMTEVKACEILTANGFDVYLLDENYVRRSKADTFFKKDGRRDFLELKDTDDKITTQYNRSIEQAPNCFITVSGYCSKLQKRNLKGAIEKNVNAKEVYLYLEKENKFLQIK